MFTFNTNVYQLHILVITLLELIKNAVSIGSENTKSKFESPVLKSNVLKLKPEATT